jgi:hypothetical protein
MLLCGERSAPFVILARAQTFLFVILTRAERRGRISHGGLPRTSLSPATFRSVANNESRATSTFRDPSASLRSRQDDKRKSALQPNEI